MKKNYIINLLLFIFCVLIIFTLKTVIFHYLTILCNIFDKTEYIKDLFEIYNNYFRKTIPLDDVYDKAPMIFDYYIKFRFEEVLFKFSILSVILLLLVKHSTISLNYFKQKKNLPIYLLAVICLCTIIFYEPAEGYRFFFLNLKHFYNNDFTNIFQYIVFSIFILSFILYISCNFLIMQYKTINSYLKIFYILSLAYFMYYFLMATWDFLYASIELAKIGDNDVGAIFLYKSYGIPVADCMNAQPKISVEKCKQHHEWTKLLCKEAMTTRDSSTTLQCKELLDFFNEKCKNVIAENKK